jgi:hypothetical protein
MTLPTDDAHPIDPVPPPDVASSAKRYRKAMYAPPEPGYLYSVRDKAHAERVIRVTSISRDGTLVQVETLRDGIPSNRPVELAVDSLARQATKGWCSLLLPMGDDEPDTHARQVPTLAGPALPPQNRSNQPDHPMIHLDSQNFGRCCADIARANIKFSTQLIKDVGDGPFRAGNYQQAFVTFEQLAVGFTSAVAACRRAIADGRRKLAAEKGNLSGREIQERTAAFTRHEQQINAAERSFATILEGLRMYVIAQQGSLAER